MSMAGADLSDVVTLQDLLRRLERFGDRIALIAFGDAGRTEIGFAALLRRSRSLAGGLVGRGLTGGAPVALFAPNSIDWVVCRFALILADALCVPVDYDADAARLRALLADSGARHLFVAPAFLDIAREAVAALGETVEIVLLEAEAGTGGLPRLDELTREVPGALPRAAAENPVARFYTAGTTGTSKAVPLTHRNILTNLKILRRLAVVGEGDRVVLPLPLHHSYPFIVGLLLPLVSGAAVIFPGGLAGPKFLEAVREGGAHVVVGVPRLYEALLAGIDRRVASMGWLARGALRALMALALFARRHLGWRIGRVLLRPLHRGLAPGLRVMACGGARLDPDVELRLEALGYALLTGYGLVETSSIATFNPPGETRIGSAGRPHEAVEMRIAPVAEMEHGEVQFRGPIVFEGYADNPEANAEAFTDGWFRTGDLGWQDSDGYLFIAGRLKEIIVLPGGKNIAPGDVEAVYGQSPYVEEIAVLERGDRLAGIVVPDMGAVREAGKSDVEQLLRISFGELGRRLPRYRRLADFVVTRESLPRNQLGKYLRHALPAIYDRAERGEAAPPAELSEEDEARLATDRARALMGWLERRFPDSTLHPDTSLQMELGIDSLAWLDLSLELEDSVGVSLSEEAIAGLVTLRDLIDAVEAAEAAEGAAEARRARARRRLTENRERWLAEPGPAARLLGRGAYGLVRLVARAMFRLSVTGGDQLPRAGPLIIVANHLSDLDPFVLGAAIPWPALRRTWWSGDARRVFGSRAGRRLARMAQIFPIDDRAPNASLDLAVEALERGRILVWFPEEWRSPTGELQRFRAGIGALVERTRADIVPALIRGTFESMPRTARLPKPHPVTIRFAARIAAADLMPGAAAGEARDRHRATAARLHDVMAALLDAERGGSPADDA